MDLEQLAALGRVIKSKHYSARRDVCVLMASPSDIEALSRPIAPSVDTRALAEELFAITSGAASIEEIKLLRKKRDQALVSIGDLWQSLRDANEEIHRLQIAGSEPQSQEQIAEIVHNAMRFEREEVPAWQAGNSHAESRARQAAMEIAALLQAAGGGDETERVQIELPPTPEPSVARVTLEFSGRLMSHPSRWPWDLILSGACTVKSEPGESVRVVEEERLPPTIIRLTDEREAARRERDEAKQHHARECAKCSALADKVIALRARVADLESQLESVACRAAAAETALESAPAASGAADEEDSDIGYALRLFVDGSRVLSHELDRQQAGAFLIAAEHLAKHLRTEYQPPVEESAPVASGEAGTEVVAMSVIVKETCG